MTALTIGILGCGKQAPKHMSGLAKAGEIEFLVADPDAGRAERLGTAKGCRWSADPDTVLSDPRVTAVDICAPTPAHAPLIRKAIAGGKDFFCEKPLCETAAEARELAAAAETAGRIGMCGFVYRFAPVFERVWEILGEERHAGTSPALGRLVSGTFRLGGRGSHALWKHRRDTGGGAINEMLVHMVDLASWFFGPMASFELVAEHLLRPRRVIDGQAVAVDAEDFVIAHGLSESGVAVTIQADLVTPAFSQYGEIQGENGTLLGSIQAAYPAFLFLEREAGGLPAGRTALESPQVNIFEAQMAEFVRAVAERRPPSRSTLADSVMVLDAMEMLRNTRTTS